jgi:sodium--glutamate symport carrier gltS
VILGTRSFTIPIHTTGNIPIAIILAIILMVTDTAALPAAAFVVAAFVAVAFVAVAFMAVAFAAVGDPYNQSVYQGSAGYSDFSTGQVQSH